MSGAFHSESIKRPDGHWVFIATQDGNRYEMVHPGKHIPFTELQLHDMRLDAMSKFEGYEVRVHVDPARE